MKIFHSVLVYVAIQVNFICFRAEGETHTHKWNKGEFACLTDISSLQNWKNCTPPMTGGAPQTISIKKITGGMVQKHTHQSALKYSHWIIPLINLDLTPNTINMHLLPSAIEIPFVIRSNYKSFHNFSFSGLDASQWARKENHVWGDWCIWGE